MKEYSFDRLIDFKYDYHYNVKRRDWVVFRKGIQINCSQEKLWELLMTPAHLELTHPYCKKHSTKKWGEVGDKDNLVFNSGKVKEREILYIDKNYFIMRLTQGDAGNKIFVKFTVAELSESKCELFFTISLDSFRNIPRPFWWLYARLKLVPSYELYISSVIKGYKFYLENNKKVTADQFGVHPYYSA